MIHERHFTVEEANALLGRIEPVLRSLREARDRLTDAEAIHEGREVYLCWQLDEPPRIAFWHDLEAGYGGRQPLD